MILLLVPLGILCKLPTKMSQNTFYDWLTSSQIKRLVYINSCLCVEIVNFPILKKTAFLQSQHHIVTNSQYSSRWNVPHKL